MKAWEASKKIESFYSGGKICVSQDSLLGYALVAGTILKFTLPDFKVEERIGIELVEFSLCVNETLVSYGADDMLIYHSDPEVKWKSNSTVTTLETDKRGLIATGSSDNSVRVYQVVQGYLTHKFKHKKPVTSVAFFEDSLMVASASLDNTLKIWDLQKYSCVKTMDFSDSIRSLRLNDSLIFASDNEKVIKINTDTWKKIEVDVDSTSLEIDRDVIIGNLEGHVLKLSKKDLSVKKTRKVSDHPIIFIKKFGEFWFVSNQESTVYVLNNKLKVVQEFIGHIDEVLDIKPFGADDLLVALNSTECKIMNRESLCTKSLKGHTDNILCTDVLDNFILTGSKDKLIKLWDSTTCLATYSGHTEDVTSISFSKKSWFVSASIDQTLKIWPKSSGSIKNALFTCKAHDKDISVVKVSSDNKIIASGSQDKSIKLWSSKLKIKKELNGHKRGVWDLSFNPQEKLLCSSSGDMTVKLWTLDSYECIRTLEGTTNSILKVLFINSIIASASSDGLLKVWDYKTGICHSTLEGHSGKIWALSHISADDASFIVTGGTDSTIIYWKDVTSEKAAEMLEAQKENIKLEQNLQMFIRNGQFVQAAITAFKLKKPQSVYNIVSAMNSSDITNFVDGLLESPDGLLMLLTHIRDWNCFKKYTSMAQKLMNEVFERVEVEKFPEVKEILQAIVVYNDKHFRRAEKLYMDCFVVEHLMNEISLMPKKRTSDDVLVKKQKLEIS